MVCASPPPGAGAGAKIFQSKYNMRPTKVMRVDENPLYGSIIYLRTVNLIVYNPHLPARPRPQWTRTRFFFVLYLKVANMFLLPLGMFSGADTTWSQMALSNILPVTLGNIVGGAVCQTGLYSAVYGSLLK